MPSSGAREARQRSLCVDRGGVRCNDRGGGVHRSFSRPFSFSCPDRPMSSPIRMDPEVERLHRHLNAIGDPAWIRDYLEAARLLIETLELCPFDPRLNASLPKDHAEYLLPITVNSRYVLATQRSRHGNMAAVIWDPLFDKLSEINSLAVRYSRFDPHRGEGIYDTPWFVRFSHPRVILEHDEIRRGWLETARYERERISASPYRRYHSPLDRKSTRLNSSHVAISYAVFRL